MHGSKHLPSGILSCARALSLVALLAVSNAAPARAQSAPPPDGDTAAEPTPSPIAALAPAEIPRRVLAGQQLLRELHPLATEIPNLDDLERDIEAVSTFAGHHLADLESDTAGTRSRRVLDDLRAEVLQARARLKTAEDELADRSVAIGTGVGRIQTELATWDTTRSQTWFASLPRALAGQIDSLQTDLERLAVDLERRIGELLGLQTRLSEVQADLDQLIERIATISGTRARSMFTADARPLWRLGLESVAGFGDQLVLAVTTSAARAFEYLEEDRPQISLQLLAWLVMVVLLELSRRQATAGSDDLETGAAFAMLRRPAATALLVVLTIGQVAIHRDAPSAWNDLVALLILISAARLLPVLLPPPMRPVLRVLAVIAVLHWMAFLVSERLLIDRFLWLATSLVGALALPRLGAWTLAAVGDNRPRLARAERALARAVAAVLTLAVVANVLGAFTFATVATHSALVSVYLSVLMWTLTEIIDGLLLLLLRSAIGRRVRILRDHGERIRATTGRIAGFLALLGWAAGTAGEIGVLGPFLRGAKSVLTASVTVGELTLSAGAVILFGLVLWLSFNLSKLIRFVLEEEFISRVELPQGVPAALSTMTHYVVIVLGFLIAVAAIGLDLTSFALVAGALGVGIGFGLQTVVNNFVSGLILLFERPIRVGDKVQLGQMAGTVTAIGIRASTVRTWEGAEVVVPNGSLLESEMINWTLSDASRRFEIRVGVAYGTDPEQVLPLLVTAATTHPKVLAEPAPMALFVGFGDSSLDFSLRAWCDFADTLEVSSALHVAVNRALADAGIEIPFPQRDLHVRSLPPGATRPPDESP